jgi:hypothetical protein
MSEIGSGGPQSQNNVSDVSVSAPPREVLQIIDDNPATSDLLGFDAVVAPVVEAICREEYRPLTIGIRGGWGTGKSTLLKLIEESLARDHPDQFLVVKVDPWEFENAEQLRSTLVEIVLTELNDRIGDDTGLGEKVRRLLGRVRFGRIAASLLKGAATVPLDGGWGMIGQLVKGMTSDVDSFVAPADEQNVIPPTMHGFRDEFAALITALHEGKHIEKVIVLVDDLDRCLPNAVVESLEAIKLFLSVDRMVFVMAADEEMVRAAIAASLAGTGRASVFANLYLEKIVQLPLTIPALTPDDAVTYTALLLCAPVDKAAYGKLRDHCHNRRARNELPLLEGATHSATSSAMVLLARQICSGLDADTAINPRRIKRFLNNFAVRRSIAGARGVQLSAAVTAKLMLLEERFRDPDFRVLAATPGPDLKELLRKWERWAKNAEGVEQKPEGVSEGSRQWAASEPSLAESDEDIASYMTLAAALTFVASGGPLSGKVAGFVDHLIAGKDSDTIRGNLMSKDLTSLDDAEVEQVMLAIAGRASLMSPPTSSIRLIVEIIESRQSVEVVGCKIVYEKLASIMDLGVSAKLAMSSLDSIRDLAARLADDPRVSPEARAAISLALSGAR